MESIFYYPHGRYLLTETTITQQIFDTSIPMHFRIIQFAHAWSETELNIITENDELLRKRIKRQITFNYKTITAFRETGAHHLLLRADQAKILIHKQTDDYPKLYAILRQKIAVLQEAEQAA